MARTEAVLEVFIASPSELADERECLVQVIDELNALWSGRLGVRLAPLRWETHAYPSFGADAQDVVNRQISDEYDLFIGMMWTCFGSATSRAGSGTVEEFDRALTRFRLHPGALQLMIYFKDAPRSPSEIDPEQLLAVSRFRSRIQAEGGLHWTFTEIDDFRATLRIHLSRFVQEWQRKNEQQVPSRTEATVEPTVPEGAHSPEDDAGFYDALESATEGIARVGETQERLTMYVKELSASIERTVGEMNDANASEGGGSATTNKRIANRLADDMEHYVRRTRLEIDAFRRQLEEVLTSTGLAATLALDFGNDSAAVLSLPSIADQVQVFGETLASNATSTLALRAAVAASPRMTTAYNRSKRLTTDVLDELARNLTSASDTCLRVASGIRDIGLGGGSGDNAPAS